MIVEREREVASGLLTLLVLLIVHAAITILGVRAILDENVVMIVLFSIPWALICVLWAGFFMVNPNEARVLQLFGSYVGTAREPGLRWANPFYTKHKVSQRIRNFETGKLKVNDANSNPIEIGCVVVWKVVDTAEAMFEVDDFVNYVHVQSEAAVRNLATDYPYDAHDHGDISLAGHTSQISGQLREEVQARLEKAGVEVIEARISHLAYAPEIAHAMLQRQQASAVVAARTKIVEGAVGMVELALHHLSDKQIIELDDERKASMVSNLLVVLCSDRGTQPVVNTGSIYQ
jgi:regulator of protease activity HflC (stomatin/prohibitin superfamily)